jgi:HtrA serine peptidase 2
MNRIVGASVLRSSRAAVASGKLRGLVVHDKEPHLGQVRSLPLLRQWGGVEGSSQGGVPRRWCSSGWRDRLPTERHISRKRRWRLRMILFASGGLAAATVGMAAVASPYERNFALPVWFPLGPSTVAHAASLASEQPDAAHGLMPSSAAPGTTEDKPLTRFAIADAVARVAPAVVNITVTMSTGDRWIFGPFSPPTTLAQSTGSGFIFDSKEGLVLTNAHVVTEMRNAPQTSEMTITLQDGRSFPGAVESVDALTDLAIVRILEAGTDLPAAELGRSSSLRTGEWVIAVGSPLMLANTVTCGIVSATNREGFEIGFPVGAPRLAFIQTDAAINIGNSGGPLVNLDGQVIGINTLKALSSDGISFALPIDLAKEVIHQLRQHGRVVRPFLGLKLLTLTPALAEELKRRSNTGFPADLSEGVCVPQVLPGGPADRGGLRAGDVVIAVDGKPVRTTRDILDQLGNRVGKPIEFTVIRGKRGQRITLQVTPEQAKS